MLCRFTLLSEAALTPRKGQFGRWRRLCGAGRTVAWTESVQRKACGACTDLVPRAWVPQWPQNGAFLPLNNGTLNEIHPLNAFGCAAMLKQQPCKNTASTMRLGTWLKKTKTEAWKRQDTDSSKLWKRSLKIALKESPPASYLSGKAGHAPCPFDTPC